MFRLLIDTCVWLDLAKDHRQNALLEVLESLVQARAVELILPQTVVDEFSRNKARVAEESGRSMSSALKRAKDIIGQLGAGKGKQLAIAHLDELDYKLPKLGEAAVEAIGRIEALFATSSALAVAEEIVLRAAHRAIDRKAPFHRHRNSIGDAILFEMYAARAVVRERGTRYAFVTHNTKDFSQLTGDTREPHPDLAPHFSPVRSLYLTSLGEALRRVDPAAVSDAMLEREWAPAPRRLADILAAMDEFTDKVWYGRHGALAHGVDSGSVKVVDRETYPRDRANPTIQADVWAGARKAARKTERR